MMCQRDRSVNTHRKSAHWFIVWLSVVYASANTSATPQKVAEATPLNKGNASDDRNGRVAGIATCGWVQLLL